MGHHSTCPSFSLVRRIHCGRSEWQVGGGGGLSHIPLHSPPKRGITDKDASPKCSLPPLKCASYRLVTCVTVPSCSNGLRQDMYQFLKASTLGVFWPSGRPRNMYSQPYNRGTPRSASVVFSGRPGKPDPSRRRQLQDYNLSRLAH